MGTRSRGQHYAFAQHVLPTLTWKHPDRLLTLFTGAEREEFLQAVWKTAGEHQPAADLVDGTTLHSSIHKQEQHTIVLITLPQPVAPVEAYFIAIVFTHPSQPAAENTIQQVRYFTLEFANDFISRQNHTVFAEVREDGHYNFGRGPRPELQAFLDHLIGFLRENVADQSSVQ
jgi:hypothetical protein